MAWTEEKISDLRKEWESGMPTAAIARKFGCSVSVIYQTRARFGLPKRVRGRKPVMFMGGGCPRGHFLTEATAGRIERQTRRGYQLVCRVCEAERHRVYMAKRRAAMRSSVGIEAAP